MKYFRRFRSIRYWHILSRLFLFVVLPLLLTASHGYAKKTKKKHRQKQYHAKQTQADLASFGVAAPNQPKTTSDKIIKTAFTQLGRAYRYGGTSPETGFDCQGFVQWTYGQNGIALPRSSGEQLGYGEHVGKEDLRPGDIIIFRRSIGSARGTHAGIYLGNGKYIHSPRTGDSIRVDNAFDAHHGSRFIGARRVIRDPSAPPMAPPHETLVAANNFSDDADEAETKASSKKERAKALAQAAQSPQTSSKAQTHVVKSGDSFATIVTRYRVPLEKLLAANKLSGRERLKKGQTLIIPSPAPAATALAKAEPAKTGVTPPAQTTQVAAGAMHVVQNGDIISSISKKYGVKTQDMLDANKLTDKSMLRIGQKLTIPGAAPTAPAPVAVAKAPARKIEEPVATETTHPAASTAKPAAQLAQADAKSKPEGWRTASLQQDHAAPKTPATAPAATAPAASGASGEAAHNTHVVQSRDSISIIAKKYGLKEQDIFDANKLTPKSVLQLGQKIRIPAAPSAASAVAEKIPAKQAAAAAPAAPAAAQHPASAPAATAPAASGASAASGEAAHNTHVVQSRDSISIIAKKYRLKEQDIFDANKLTPKSVLQLGQKIRIPAAPSAAPAVAEKSPPKQAAAAAPAQHPASAPAATAPAASGASGEAAHNTHVVQSGDSISIIAKKYGLKEQDIFDANKLTPKSVLQLGQKIRIPAAPSAAPAVAEKSPAKQAAAAAPAAQLHTALDIQATHVVQSGDNYSNIAHKYGLKSQALLDANKLSSDHTLQLGEKLVVPKVTDSNAYQPGKKNEKAESQKDPAKKEGVPRKKPRRIEDEE